jgi:dTDP-4-dehydrorhamnose reductase
MTQPLHVLVLGASGQVGHALAKGTTDGAHTLKVTGLTRHEVDLAGPLFSEQLRAALDAHQPTHVINAAAYTAVDRAELEPDVAKAVNTESVEVLGAVCAELGLPVIHLSTDYVFDGQKPIGQAYLPDDPVSPQGVYGRTKQQGEARFLAATTDHPALVFRTSWVFSDHGGNFVKTMINLAQQRDQLTVVGDQHGAPTSAHWIAQSLLRICQSWPTSVASPPVRGIFHLSAAGQTNWHAFAQHLLEAARMLAPQRAWRIQSNEQVRCVSTDAYLAGLLASGRTDPIAPRPTNSLLDNRSTLACFPIHQPDWSDQLVPVLRKLLSP